MVTTPTTEPERVTAGDTIAWSRALSDYPATDGWALKYRLISATAKIDITAAASGADHAVTVPASTSATWVAGWYDWQAYVEKAAERYTVGTGRIQILPNLAGVAAAGYDNRSQARQILDSLLAAYQSAVQSRAFVQEYEIAGRRMRFQAQGDWIGQIEFWKREVAAEERLQRIRDGLGPAGKLYVRF